MEASAGGPMQPGEAYLLSLDGESAGPVHLPREGRIVLGSSEEADVRVRDVGVLGIQAWIEMGQGGAVLQPAPGGSARFG